MGWLLALIEIVATAALSLFGVNVETAEVCTDPAAETRTVEYVETARTPVWDAARYSPAPATTCITGQDPALPEADPVFLIEI